MFQEYFFIKETDCKSMILGCSFLRKCSAVLRFASSILEIKAQSNVFVSSSVTVPARCEFVVPAKVDGMIPDGAEGVVESANGSVADLEMLLVNDTLTLVREGKVTLLIINANDYDVKLKRGDFVGRFVVLNVELSEINENHLICDNGEARVKDLRGNLFADHFTIDNDELSQDERHRVVTLLEGYADVFF